GIRSTPSLAAGEFLPAGVVCDHPLFGAALDERAALGLPILLVVRARRLLRAAVFHTARAPRARHDNAGTGVRRSLRRTAAIENHGSQGGMRRGIQSAARD